MKKNAKTEVRKIQSSVDSTVRAMESRVATTEAIQRLAIHVQFDSLAKAERLRRLGLAYQQAFATRKAGLARAALFRFLITLETPFHKPLPARDMKKVRAFLRRRQR